jgi:exopolysaccharide biosynthesis polyprenyl glycosylphosphotransferase
MFNRQRKTRVLFVLSDIALVAAAFWTAYQTRSMMRLENEFYMAPERIVLVLGLALTVCVVAGLGMRVYDKLDSGRPRVVLRDSFRQSLSFAICLALLQYALRLKTELSRPFVALFCLYACVFMALFRIAAARAAKKFRREFASPHYVMVVGTGERALRLAGALERSSEYGVRLRGFLSETPEEAPAAVKLDAAYKVRPISELPAILRQQVVDEVIFAVESDRLAQLEESFLLCDEEGVRTRVAVDFFPHVNSTVSLERFGETPLLTFSAAPYDEVRLLAKRVTDVVISGVGLLVMAPLMLAVAALVRLTSPGPAIFKQVRCGLNGRRFDFFKFRSMCQNAEELRASVEHLNTRDQIVFKIPDDPRLTPLGRWLRKFSIDEWPQLWNVLRGDMSIVGPRPAIPGEVDRYQRWQRRRLRMRPGLTCIWAISGRDKVDFETWMKMDLQYIDNWSLALDWKILLRTIPRVLTGSGAN